MLTAMRQCLEGADVERRMGELEDAIAGDPTVQRCAAEEEGMSGPAPNFPQQRARGAGA